MVATFAPNTAVGLSEQNAIARLKDEGYNELPSAQSRNLLKVEIICGNFYKYSIKR